MELGPPHRTVVVLQRPWGSLAGMQRDAQQAGRPASCRGGRLHAGVRGQWRGGWPASAAARLADASEQVLNGLLAKSRSNQTMRLSYEPALVRPACQTAAAPADREH